MTEQEYKNIRNRKKSLSIRNISTYLIDRNIDIIYLDNSSYRKKIKNIEIGFKNVTKKMIEINQIEIRINIEDTIYRISTYDLHDFLFNQRVSTSYSGITLRLVEDSK